MPSHSRIVSQLIKQHGSACQFCGVELVQISTIPESRRVKTASGLLFFNEGDKVVSKNYATLEHCVRRADGGDYSPGNLKLACHRCNQDRNKAATYRSLLHTKAQCHNCGKFFGKVWYRQSSRKFCHKCNRLDINIVNMAINENELVVVPKDVITIAEAVMRMFVNVFKNDISRDKVQEALNILENGKESPDDKGSGI